MQARVSERSLIPEDIQPADAWITGFTYRQTQAGSAKWEVVAERAQVFEAQHVAYLEQLKVHMYGEENREMTVTADEGTIDTATNNFDLKNRNDLVSIELANGFTVLSNQFRWRESSRQIKSQDHVVIRGPGLTITGTGLEGNLDQENFKILKNVRAEISPSG